MKKGIITLILAVLTVSAFADGAGGTFYGKYNYEPGFASDNMDDYTFYGGFGYGENWEGIRTGGFGMVINNGDDFQAAYGGLISGKEVIDAGPISLAVNLWTGMGWDRDLGVSAIGDANVEAGIEIFPWMQLQIFAGMHGRVGMVDILNMNNYSPVFGARIAWGSF